MKKIFFLTVISCLLSMTAMGYKELPKNSSFNVDYSDTIIDPTTYYGYFIQPGDTTVFCDPYIILLVDSTTGKLNDRRVQYSTDYVDGDLYAGMKTYCVRHPKMPEVCEVPEWVTLSGKRYHVVGLASHEVTYTYYGEKHDISYFGQWKKGESIPQINEFKKMILPESVKTIDKQALAGRGIEEIIAPGVVSVGLAVCGSMRNLKNADFPKLEVMYGSNCFDDCNSLVKVNMPRLRESRAMAFSRCTSLESISLPELVNENPDNGSDLFWNCPKLQSVYAPKLKTLTAWTFASCPRLKSVDLSMVDSVSPHSNSAAVFYGTDSIKEIYMPKLKYLSGELFWGNNQLETIRMPSLLKINNSMAFNSCTKIRTIDMPELREFDDSLSGFAMFTNLDSLRYISLPKFKGKMGYSFYYCHNLKYINLPSYNPVLKEGEYEYWLSGLSQSDPNIETLLLPSLEKMVGFTGNDKLHTLDIRSVKKLLPDWDGISGGPGYGSNYQGQLYNAKKIKHIICNSTDVLHEIARAFSKSGGMSFMPDSLFHRLAADYDGFDSVEVYNQTEALTDQTFDHMPNIKNIVIHGPSIVKHVKAFDILDKLETVDVADDETDDYSSKDGVLYDRDGTTLLYYPHANENTDRPFSIPTNLKAVGEYAFYNYPNKNEIAFGLHMESISDHALDGSAIEHVTFDLRAPFKSVGEYAFANMTQQNFRYLKFPSALEAIGRGAFSGDTYLEAVELYDSKLTTIPDSAFTGPNYITSIALPNTIKTIGKHAFKNDYGLEYFTIPRGCESIGEGAFSGTTTVFNMLNIQAMNDGIKQTIDKAFDFLPPVFAPEGTDLSWAEESYTRDEAGPVVPGRYYTFTRSYPVDLSKAADNVNFFRVSRLNVDKSLTDFAGILYIESLTVDQLKAVPSNTPLMMIAKPGIVGSVNIEYSMLDNEPEAWKESPLKGTPGAIRLDNKTTDINGTEYSNFILTYPTNGEYSAGTFSQVSSKNWDEIATRRGQQAYLQIESEQASNVKAFIIRQEDTTGISSVDTDSKSDDAWYNMQGQKVGNPHKGIYILNGKKVVVK